MKLLEFARVNLEETTGLLKKAAKHRLLVPYFALICGLAGTGLATFFVQQNLRAQKRQQFTEDILQVEETVRTRMAAYLGLLRGGAALFAANQFVTHEQFRDYYHRLQVEKNYPGLQGYGYTIRFASNKLAAIETMIRGQGITNFHVWPPGPREEYHSIIFLEPPDERNLEAIGFDMFTEAKRREAMSRARDTGDAAASSRVRLVQEIKGPEQPGFLIYVPLYLGGNIPETVEERRQKLQGFIYSPFRATDLFNGMFEGTRRTNISFTIYDGREAKEEEIIYQYGQVDREPFFTATKEVVVAGEPWLLSYEEVGNGRVMKGEKWLPIVPTLGLLATVFLFYFTRAEGVARRKSELAARELSDHREWLDVTLSSIGDGVITTDLDGRIQYMNQVAEELTGCKADAARGRFLPEVIELVHEESGRKLLGEAVARVRNGGNPEFPQHMTMLSGKGNARELCVEPGVAPIRDSRGKLAGIALAVRDVTDRRRNERRITAQHAVTSILAESLSLEDAAGSLLEALCDNLHFDLGIFWLFDHESGEGRVFRIWHEPGEHFENFDAASLAFKPKPGEGLPGLVWKTASPQWLENFRNGVNYPRAQAARASGFSSSFAFGVVNEGKVYGALEFLSRTGGAPDEELQKVAGGLGAQIGQFIERRRAEVRLQESEELYRAISETAADGIITIDENGTVLTVNPALERIFGWTREELVGRSLELLMPEGVRRKYNEGLKRFLATGQKRISWAGVEIPGLHKNGEEIPLELSFGMSVKGGKYLFTGLIRDIRRRKESEEKLRESEERFGLLVRQAAEYAIITLNAEGRVSTWNIGAQRIFGYSDEEVLGRENGLFYTEEDRRAEAPEKQMRAAALEGQVLDERWQVRKDGSTFWASGSIYCLRSEEGAIRGYAQILRDITERKKTEEAVRQLNMELELRVVRRTAALQESKEQMEAFTYTVAHDLRAPLRAMQGFSHALVEDYGATLDTPAQDYLQRIMASAEKMDSLIQDLLEYSRLSRSDLTFRSVPVREVVEGAVSALQNEIKTAGAVVNITAPELYVRAHAATLEHAIFNLVGNSLKFVGQAKPEVSIRAIDHNGKVQISVQDNGIGIAPEYQERIFRVFERLHGQETYPGTGIGLAIVKKGIERMGGRVGVVSEPGQGSLFWLELPQATAADSVD